MRKKRNRVGLGVIVMFLFVDILFFWNIAQDILFVSHIQETTGTIIQVEETTHNWDAGRSCEFSYTVDGTYYRRTFTWLCEEISPEPALGKSIAVSYCEDNPENARQGSVAKIIGIFVLKCSLYIVCNMVLVIGWVLRMFLRTNYFFSPRLL